MVADSSATGQYGRLKAYGFPTPARPGGCRGGQHQRQRRQFSISAEPTRFDRQYEDLLLIPIKDSVLYVRPLCVTSRRDFGVVVRDRLNGEDVEIGVARRCSTACSAPAIASPT
jgi:hypothetical protein